MKTHSKGYTPSIFIIDIDQDVDQIELQRFLLSDISYSRIQYQISTTVLSTVA